MFKFYIKREHNMIIRVLDDNKVKFIPVSPDQEDTFIELNPTGGFKKIDRSSLPNAQYGNYMWDGSQVVVDEDAEAQSAAVQYKIDRVYPSIGEQLDMLYHDIKNGTLESGEFVTAIDAIKTNVPKPE